MKEKKYRLKIPDLVPKELIEQAEYLLSFDGKVQTRDWWDIQFRNTLNFKSGPTSRCCEWLEPVYFCECGKEVDPAYDPCCGYDCWSKKYEQKEESDPAEEWLISKYSDHYPDVYSDNEMKKAYRAGMPNYKWEDENHWYDALPDIYKVGQSEATMKAVFQMAREVR